MRSLLSLLGYSKPIPLHDHTDSRQSLRSIEHRKSGDPLGDPTFATHIDHVTTPDERAEKTARLVRIRRTAAALLCCSVAGFAAETRQLSQAQPASTIALTSPARISADGLFVAYAQGPTVSMATDLWSVPLAGGTPVRLSRQLVAGQIIAFALTPDSARAIYLADEDTLGTPELYSVPLAGGPSQRISKDLVAGGHVLDFRVAPASGQVYYRADASTNNVVELWRVSAAGGPSTRVNRALPSTTYDVFEYAAGLTAGGSERVVYRVGRSTVGGHKLWSAPSSGTSAQAVEISRPMVTGGAALEFAISPDGERVVYRADALDNGRFDLWSVPIAGGASTRLDRDDGRSVLAEFTVSASGVTYAYSPAEFYRVPVTGGASVSAPPPMPEPVRSPDGEWIVYGAGVGLWSSHTSGDHQLVSCAGQTVTAKFLGQPTYSVSPDSQAVLYVAGELWAGPISGAVCLIFRDSFESGDAARWSR